jgi:ribonuclease Z
MNMEAFVLGCGGMMPLPRRHLTSVLLRREGELFLFDCGEGTQVSLRKLNLKWKKITAIFISHTHADHVTGLPGIMMLSSQVDREEPLYIIGPPKIRDYVEMSKSVLDMYINYEIRVIEITGPGIIYTGEEFAIHAFRLRHSKPCMGYTLIENPRPGVFFPEKAERYGVPRGPLWSKLQMGEDVRLQDGRVVSSADVMGPAREGRKFSYITDTLYLDSIPEQIDNSDLLICEGMFTEELRESAKEKKHLTSMQAAFLAKKGNVEKLGLIHYSPRYTEYELKQLLKEASEIFPKTFLTRDGQTISIPFRT